MPTTIPEIDPFDSAEERFMREEEKLLRRLKECREMLARIREGKKRLNNTGGSDLPPIKPGEYASMRPVDALAVYLRTRRGSRIPLSHAVKDLIVGGVYPGQPRGKKNDPAALVTHSLKIALPNRRDTFGWEPEETNSKGHVVIPRKVSDDHIRVWLEETAVEIPRRRKRNSK